MLRSSERPRVLVVDDRPEMAKMVADDLCDRGYRGCAMSSSRDALRMLRNERVDALVTDLRMPEIDGLDLCRASRELDPSRPVIVMTAYETLETAIEASASGACQYVTKPFRLDVLARLLDHSIERALRRRFCALQRE
jgi:two-component system response regulator AtoC